jgi:predicted GIY-YIG superfamily endonuclease
MKFYVYLLRCSNGTYYVGHTDDVTRRLEEHNSGKGAEHTRKYRPVHLVYTEPFDSESDAVLREIQIKSWSQAKKASLAAGDLQALKKLAKRRTK